MYQKIVAIALFKFKTNVLVNRGSTSSKTTFQTSVSTLEIGVGNIGFKRKTGVGNIVLNEKPMFETSILAKVERTGYCHIYFPVWVT